MALARSVSESGAHAHSSAGSDRKTTSAFLYSVLVTRTTRRAAAMQRESSIDSVSTGFLFFAVASFCRGAPLTDTDAATVSAASLSTPAGHTRVRHRVLAMTVVLAAITYLDRVTISVTRPDIARDLGLSADADGLCLQRVLSRLCAVRDSDRLVGQSGRHAAGPDADRLLVVGVHRAHRRRVQLPVAAS